MGGIVGLTTDRYCLEKDYIRYRDKPAYKGKQVKLVEVEE
jgi:hypothetical protein